MTETPTVLPASEPASPAASRSALPPTDYVGELGVRLLALRAFSEARFHPLTEDEQTQIATRDFTAETRIWRRYLLDCARLAFALCHSSALRRQAEAAAQEDDFLLLPPHEAAAADAPPDAINVGDDEWLALANALVLAAIQAAGLTSDNARVGFATWHALTGGAVAHWATFAATRAAEIHAVRTAETSLPPALLNLTRNIPGGFGMTLRRVFENFARLLFWLDKMRDSLLRDQPLKIYLPLLALVHSAARDLLREIEQQVARRPELTPAVAEAIDGTAYVAMMDVRRVFTQELAGFSSLRQATVLYAKAEHAYGLLNNSFQQSVIALAQIYDPRLNYEELFSSQQARMEQSLALRNDLWRLLKWAQRGERERDAFPLARFLALLDEFRAGSLHYLPYRDAEPCERFIEEVELARGTVELAPVLHRFAAFLETLHGQVNMRAVLAAHPFDYPSEVGE